MTITPKEIAGIIRLPFLLLSPACIMAGFGLSWWKTGGNIDLFLLLPIITGGIAAHISVNALNEYTDFKNGLDMITKKTPFSGGSGTIPNNPALAPVALRIAVFALLLTSVIGFYFLISKGYGILLSGVPGVLLVILYSSHIVKTPFLSMIAPGIGFGYSMVMGCEYILTGSYSWGGFWIATCIFFLVNNLLLINQIPDIDADKTVGRRNIPMLWKHESTTGLIGLFFLLAYLSLLTGVFTKALPLPALSGILILPLAVRVFAGLHKTDKNPPALTQMIPLMGMNVATVLATPLLVTAGILLF